MSEIRKEEEKRAEAKKEARAKPVPKKEADRETVMYVGPSIRGVACTGTLYRNGLPEVLKREMERRPAVGGLVGPVSALAAAQRQLATPGSALAVLYGKVRSN